MKSDQVHLEITDCYLQNTQYLLISPFTYQHQINGQLILIYDRQKFKRNSDLIDQYKRMTRLELEREDILKLEVRLSCKDREEVWKPISEDIYIETWLNGEGLQRQSEIFLRLAVQKQGSYLGESAYIPYGEDYFNSKAENYEQIGFYVTHLNKLFYKKCKGNKRLITYLKEIKELGVKYDENAYELRVMKFSLDKQVIGPMIIINAVNYETGRRYIVNKDMIEVRKKDFQSQENKAMNLRILGPNVSIRANYTKFSRFRCENICSMAGLPFPETYSFEYRSNFIKNNECLEALHLQNYYQRSQAAISIRIMDERSLFDYLLRQSLLYYPLPDPKILEKLESLHKLPRESSQIQQKIGKTSSLNIPTEDDIFRWISFCSVGNKFLREKELPNKISENIRKNPELSYILTMAQILQTLPFSINETVFRTANYRVTYNQGDICTFKNFLSTSKNARIAQSFFRKYAKYARTTLEIKNYSGRNVSQFSLFKDEQQVLFNPFSTFIVRSAKEQANEMRLILQELPSVRNTDRKHIVWIGENVDKGIKIVNQIRSSYPKKEQLVDILPFQNNEMLKIYSSHSPYYTIPKERTIVVFSLAGSLQQREWRLKFIKQMFSASLYIFLTSSREDRLSIQHLNPVSVVTNARQVEINIKNKFFGLSMTENVEKNTQGQQKWTCGGKEDCQLI